MNRLMCNELTDLLCFHQTLGSVMENLPHTNMAELLISLVCLAVLVPVKEINTRFRQRLRTPIPVEILTVSVMARRCLHIVFSLSVNFTSSLFLYTRKSTYFLTSDIKLANVNSQTVKCNR